MPIAQREAFLMKESAGLSLAKIARITGTSEEGVKSRIRHAMQKLRVEGGRVESLRAPEYPVAAPAVEEFPLPTMPREADCDDFLVDGAPRWRIRCADGAWQVDREDANHEAMIDTPR
jgi:biotin operon repressor